MSKRNQTALESLRVVNKIVLEALEDWYLTHSTQRLVSALNEIESTTSYDLFMPIPCSVTHTEEDAPEDNPAAA